MMDILNIPKEIGGSSGFCYCNEVLVSHTRSATILLHHIRL
jgi:hypothetical protein